MNLEQKKQLCIEHARLKNFLYLNQLVQANAIIQILEKMIQDLFLNESPCAIEEHPLWPALRCCLSIKSKILCGRNREAYYEADALGEMLNK